MQSVVRSSLIGLLAIAGLTACGDKVTENTGDNVVHSVTVTPAVIANLQVGGSFTLAASVDAGSGVTNRNVTWTSSDPSIASVDAATGKVTGVKVGGPVTITAASAADASVKGAALVTVVAAGGSAVPIVTVSTVNVTNGAGNSVPANLLNVAGQVDVTLNVEANGAALSKITGVLKCGNDSLTVVQNVGPSTSVVAADEAAAPVTMSFNTAAFNPTTGAPALKNGQCTVSGFATTTSGVQSAINTTSFTLNNLDMAVVTVSSTNSATDPTNRPWIGGGPFTVTALPVMYSGRTPVAATIGVTPGTLTSGSIAAPNPASQTISSLTSGAFSATWSNGSTAPTVRGFAAVGNAVTVSITDNSGAIITAVGAVTVKGGTFSSTPTGGLFNLDEQKPAPGTFSVINNPDQGIIAAPAATSGYIGTAFKFAADSASGYRGPAPVVPGAVTANSDFGGVDKVTVVFQTATNATGAAFTTVTNTTTLAQSDVSTAYKGRMITLDAVGNADTTAFTNTFGVDKTAPTVDVTGTANQSTTTVANGNGSLTITIGDALSGPGVALVAQVRQWNGIASAANLAGNEGWVSSNIATVSPHLPGSSGSAAQNPCYIGRFNGTQAAAGANALPVLSASGATIGFCTPVPYTVNGVPLAATRLGDVATTSSDGYWYTTVIPTDVAANQAAPINRVVLEDVTPPTVSAPDLPATIVGNSTVTIPATATDNAAASVGDIVGSFVIENFTGARLRFNTTAGPGVAFDNVLTNTATITPTLTNFIKNLHVGATTVVPIAGENVASVDLSAVGAAGNNGSLNVPLNAGIPAITAGATSTFTATSILDWSIQAPPNAGNVTNCVSDNCAPATATQPNNITLTVTATGNTGVFANPFATAGSVQFWYRPAGSLVWYQIGASSAGSSRDNGINRFWDYQVNWNPPNFTPDQTSLTTAGLTIDVAAIGTNAAGDAIMSPPVTITIANP